MRLEQCGRPGCWTGTALNTVCDEHPTALPRRPQAFCELHGVNIVDGFPGRCPLATANPLTTIGQLRDLAFQSDDACDAVELFDRVDVCGRCIDVNGGHRTVRRLRRELGVNR
jgi:hypothetical protein